MTAHFNRVYFLATSSGTGNFVVSSAVVGYRTPAGAGIPNNTIVDYVAESADKTQWEIGRGAYTTADTTLARTVIRESTNSNNVVNFSAAPRVFIMMPAQEVFPGFLEDAATNAAVNFPIRVESTGTPAAGIGAGVAFEVETAAGNVEIGALIQAVTTDVTDASEDFDLVIKLMAGGSAAAEALRITSAQKLISPNAAFSFGGFEAVFSDAGADRVFGWDELTNRYKTMALADIATEVSPAAGDFLLAYLAEGNLVKIDWSSLPSGSVTAPLTLTVDDATNNAPTTILTLRHTTTGTPAAGIASRLAFEIEAAATIEIGATIEAVATDVTDTSEDFDIVFKSMAGGAVAAERFRIKPNQWVFTDEVQGSSSLILSSNALGATGNFGAAGNLSWGSGWGQLTGGSTGLVISQTGGGSGGLTLQGGSDQLIQSEIGTSATNTVQSAFRLRHSTSGTPAVGIGVSISFQQETANDNYEILAAIAAVTTDVTGSSEDADLTFSVMTAGAAAAESMRIKSGATKPVSFISTDARAQLTIKSDNNDPIITNDGGSGVHLILHKDGNATGLLRLTSSGGLVVFGISPLGPNEGIFLDAGNAAAPNSSSIVFDQTGSTHVCGIGLVQHSGPAYLAMCGRPSVDEVKYPLWITGAAAAAGATTNLDGGNINIRPGDGASGSSGDADGGHLFIQGGRGYGTGNGGDIILTTGQRASGGGDGVIRVEANTALTNALATGLAVRHFTSGTPAAGIGVSILLEQETANDNFEIGAVISAVTTDVGSATEDFDVTIGTMAAGATAAERIRVSENGITPSTRNLEKEVILTDGANITLNSRLGNTFKVVAAGNRQIDAPTNKPASGEVQKIVIMHEASGADRTLTLQTGVAGGFRFGTDITALTATTNGLVDYIGCVYNDADDRWDIVAYAKGY